MVTSLNMKPGFKESSRPGRLVNFGVIILLVLVSIYNMAPGKPGCGLEADHHQPGDYCYRTKVTVSNLNTTPLSNYPVRLSLPSNDFTAQGFIGPNGWSIRTYNISLNPVEVVAQDLSSNTSPWWLAVTANASDGATPTTWSGWIYMGSPFVARDQAVNLAGSDLMTVPDDFALEWTDDFDLVATAAVSPTYMTQAEAGWVDKYTAGTNSGYWLGFDNGNVVGKVGDGTTTNTVSAAWDGLEATWRLRFDSGAANKLELFKWNTQTNAWDSAATGGTITSVLHNANDFLMGKDFTGVLRNVKTYKDVGLPGYAKVQEYAFNPVDITETSASDPNYSGTIVNLVDSAAHPASFAWSRSQANISYTMGPVMPVYASPAESVPEQFATIFNNPTDSNLFAAGTLNSNMPFYGVFESARSDMGLPGDAFWTLVFGGTFGLLGIAILLATRRPEIAAVVPGVGLLFGAFNGLLAPWITLMYALAAGSIYLIGKWGQE